MIKERPNGNKSRNLAADQAALSLLAEKQSSIGVTSADVQAVNEQIRDQSIVLQTPGKLKQKALLLGDLESKTNNEDSQGKKSTKTAAKKSKQSSRVVSARRNTLSDGEGGAESVLAQGKNLADERTSTLSQNELSESKDVMPDDLPHPISSKSPKIKSYSSKMQQIQKSNSLQPGGRSDQQRQPKNQQALNNSIIQEDDSPQKQHGYRYASLQPQKRDNEVDTTPKLPMIRKLPQGSQHQQLPPISNSVLAQSDTKGNY